MSDRGLRHAIPLLSAILSMTTLSGTSHGGLFHQGEVTTRINLSQGYRYGDTIFFLADCHRYQRGRTFWFILPMNAGPKTLSHQTRLYSLDAKAGTLRQEAVLKDPAELTCMVSSTKWVMKDGGLYVAYNPSNRIFSQTGHTERIVFRRDMATGTVSAVTDPEVAHAELFADYKSPYRANPGIVEISEYKTLIPPGQLEKQPTTTPVSPP